MNDDHSPLALTEIHYLTSAATGGEFKIFVGQCGDERAGPAIPVYVLDANGYFGAAIDIIRSLQLDAHVPRIVVIGIGYRRGALRDTIVDRTRDLTPTSDPSFSEIFPDQTAMGGATRFLDFIRDELQPWAERTWEVRHDDSMIFGHSLGGLFASHVLLTAPDTFSRYGVSSPSLWWHDDVMFDLERAYAAQHSDLVARAFFTTGEYEDFPGRLRELEREPPHIRAIASLRHIDMVESTVRFEAVLRSRGYPGLRTGCAVFPGEFHITSGFLALSRSLRVLYDAPL